MKDIIVLEGPSGVGKDSIIGELIRHEPNKFEKIVAYTDRPMRDGETNGLTYNFISTKEFENRVKIGDIFEVTHRHGTSRGMSKSLIKSITDKGKIAIKDCDLVGVNALKKLYPNRILTIFVTATKDLIEKHLIKRGDSEQERLKRLVDYDNKIKEISHFDFVIENKGSLDETVKKVNDIIRKHHSI